MIIDANVHITENGEWFGSGKNAAIETLIAALDDANVDKALVLPITGSIANEKLVEIISRFPERLIVGASFNPALFDSAGKAAEAFISEFAASPIKIIKFHNRFGKYTPTDGRFLKVLEQNNNLPVPKLVAVCGFFNDKNMDSGIVPPLYIFDLAKKFQGTNFIIMHGAGTWIMKTAEMIRDMKNVFLDLSFTLSKYKGSSIDNDIKWLCSNFDKRLIWGSDFPEFTVKEALNDFYAINKDLAAEKQENILGKNLMELLSNG